LSLVNVSELIAFVAPLFDRSAEDIAGVTLAIRTKDGLTSYICSGIDPEASQKEKDLSAAYLMQWYAMDFLRKSMGGGAG